MMMMQRRCLVAVLALACGCAAQVGEPSAETDTATELTETVVTLHDDGSSTVEVHALDPDMSEPAPYDDEPGVESAELINRTACGGANLTLFDRPGAMGSRICFFYQNSFPEEVRLREYCHRTQLQCVPGLAGRLNCSSVCQQSWVGQVRSVIGGDEGGFLYRHRDASCRDHWNAYERRDTLSCSSADLVQLGTAGRLVDVYRMLRPGHGHFYTTSPAEQAAARTRGYVDEGVGFRCWSAPVFNSFPVHRLYSPSRTEYGYAAGEIQIGSMIAEGWQDEGVLCHMLLPLEFGADALYGPVCDLQVLTSDFHTDRLLTVDPLEARYADACVRYDAPLGQWGRVYAPAGFTGCSGPVAPDVARWRDTGVCPSPTSPPPPTGTVRETTSVVSLSPSWFWTGYIPYSGSFPTTGTIDGDLLDVSVGSDWNVYFLRPGYTGDCSTLDTSPPGGFFHVGPGGSLGSAGMSALFPADSTPSLRAINATSFQACAMYGGFNPSDGARPLPLSLRHTARW